LPNTTLRQFVWPTVSDQQIRIQLSNEKGPVEIQKVTTDLRSSPGKQRALPTGVEPEQGREQDERTATPDEEVPVLQQQPKESVEEKDGEREAPNEENCDAVCH
jgi:hypothetical protein